MKAPVDSLNSRCLAKRAERAASLEARRCMCSFFFSVSTGNLCKLQAHVNTFHAHVVMTTGSSQRCLVSDIYTIWLHLYKILWHVHDISLRFLFKFRTKF